MLRSIAWLNPRHDEARRRACEIAHLDVTWLSSPDEFTRAHASALSACVVEGTDADRVCGDLRALARRRADAPLLGCLPREAASHAPALLAAGARDVLLAPDTGSSQDLATFGAELCQQIEGICGNNKKAPPAPSRRLVAESGAMRSVVALAERAARSSASVLLSGDTGVGKEGIARIIHEAGPRRRHRFIALNCAALPETLLESELFGHCRGAFTGADRDRRGLFEQAGEGTLLLDEIGEAPPSIQAKLLRVLQEREVRPVGATRERAIGCRIVAATNRDLRAEAERGRFRLDLYYRLVVIGIRIPPLRDRRADVLPLAKRFLAIHGEREAKPGCRLARSYQHLLLAHSWPGNARELENEIQRALALADPGELLTPRHASPHLAQIEAPLAQHSNEDEPLRSSLDRIEAVLIRRALGRHGGHRSATARSLGVTREGLYKKMKRLGIE